MLTSLARPYLTFDHNSPNFVAVSQPRLQQLGAYVGIATLCMSVVEEPLHLSLEVRKHLVAAIDYCTAVVVDWPVVVEIGY